MKQFLSRFHGVNPARFAKGNPFQQINPPLSRFDPAYDAERPLKPSDQLPLRKLSADSHVAHGISNLLLTKRVKRLPHHERSVT